MTTIIWSRKYGGPLVRVKGTVSFITDAAVYACGKSPPHYQVPALLQDSESRLDVRWSKWYDTDRSFGIRY